MWEKSKLTFFTCINMRFYIFHGDVAGEKLSWPWDSNPLPFDSGLHNGGKACKEGVVIR